MSESDGQHDKTPPSSEDETERSPLEGKISDAEYAEVKASLKAMFPESYRDIDAEFEWPRDSYVVDPGSYTDIAGPSQSPESIRKWISAAERTVDELVREDNITHSAGERRRRLRHRR